jgi:hypothetical protein
MVITPYAVKFVLVVAFLVVAGVIALFRFVFGRGKSN